MVAIEEQIKAIEAEIAKTKYNKATQHHIGLLKAKIAHLKLEAEKRKAKSGGPSVSYAVSKSGDATVALVGLPSVGKSTILNGITNADSQVAAYAFTTLTVIPGLLEHKGAKIQVLDLPGLIGGASTGKGRGKEVISVVRTADLVMFVLDPYQPDALGILKQELYGAGVRVNERPADIRITKHDRGGINVMSTVKLTHLSEDDIAGILREFAVSNADVLLRQDATMDQLIDVIAGNRIYAPAIIALNKCDMVNAQHIRSVIKGHLKGWKVVPIAASERRGLPDLVEAMYEALDFIRIYMKPPGKPADMKTPLVLRRGATIQTVCKNLHRDMEKRFRYALVWGKSAKFPGQTVGIDHRLDDEDVLTLVVRK